MSLDEELEGISYGSGVDKGCLRDQSTVKHLFVLRQMCLGIQDCDQYSPGYPCFEAVAAAANISNN